MPLAPHSTTTDHPPVAVRRQGHTAPVRGAIQGCPPREQRKRHEAARHFSRSTTPILPSTHVDFRATHV